MLNSFENNKFFDMFNTNESWYFRKWKEFGFENSKPKKLKFVIVKLKCLIKYKSPPLPIKKVMEHVPRHTNTSVIVSNGDKQLDYDIEEGQVLDIGVDNNVNSDCCDHRTVHIL